MEPAATAELQCGSIGSWLTLVGFVVRNWFRSWIFFLPDFLLNLTRMFTGAVIFYMMGQLVTRGAAPHLAEYRMSYGAYIITGVMFNMVMEVTLNAYHNACLHGYWSNEFDVYLQHPGGVSALLTGVVIARYIVAALNTVTYFLVGVGIFRIPISLPHLPDVLVILVLAVAAVTGLGLAGASTFSLLNARAQLPNPVEWLVGFGVTLLAGVYFPPTVLPGWLQQIGEWLPQTHALHAARLCLSGQATLISPSITTDLLFLLKFAALMLPVGLLLFEAGMRKAQRDGTLTRWS